LNHPKILILLTAVQWKPTNAIVNSPTANQAFCRRRFAGIEMFFARNAFWSFIKPRYLRYFLSKKKDKTDRYYTLKEILYAILLMEPSIEPEKIVINNLQLDRLKL
jgi:hypothetical protein